MAEQKFLTNLDVAGTVDLNNLKINTDQGTDGQVLTSTGTGVGWEDAQGGASETAERIEVTVKNISGGSLSKGTVVHTAPSANPPNGNVIEVIAADYDNSTKMPAIGILNETIANEAEGSAVMTGALSGINTSSFSIGDELYVGNLGTLTNSKPTTAGQLIQKIAVVIKSHASNGLIKIFGAGRSNDVPLPLYIDNTNQRVGIGEPDPDYKLHVNGQIYSESSTFPVYFLQRETSTTGDGTFTTTSGIASGFHLRTNSSGTIQDGFGGGVVFSLTDSGTSSNTAARIYARRDGGNTTGALQFWGGLNGNSPLMTMRASGNIGIGTSNPSRKLSVSGAIELSGVDTVISTGNPAIRRGNSGEMFLDAPGNVTVTIDSNNNQTTALFNVRKDSGTELFRIQENGNVGIGTISPSEKLHVSGGKFLVSSSAYTEMAVDQTDSGKVKIGISSGTAEGFLMVRNDEAGHVSSAPEFKILLNDSEKLRLDSTGLGIGTTNPGYKLEVNGTAKADKFVSLVNTSNSGITRDWAIIGTGDRGAGLQVNDISGAKYAIYAGGYDLTFGKHVSSNNTYTTALGIYAADATDSSPYVQATHSLRAPMFYDSGNSNFNWDPNTDLSHRFRTASGYLDIGPKNSSWCHLYTDRNGFYFNKTTFQLNGNQVFHDGYHPNADTLTTARTIAGTSFNGSANIDISYNNLTNKPTIPTNYLRDDAFDSGIGLYLQGGSFNAGTDTVTAPLVIDEEDFIYTKDGGYLRKLIGKTGDQIQIGQGGTSLITSINFLPGTAGNSAVKINSNTVWNAGNDGAGSGLDADLLDGVQGSSYLRSDVNDSVGTGRQISFYSNDNIESGSGDQASLEVFQDTSGADAFMQFHVSGDFAAYFGLDGSTNDFAVGGWSMGASKYKVWHAGNDGASSGLDADLLDGQQGSYYDHRGYTVDNNYLGGYYVSGGTEKPNDAIFGSGKFKVAMLRGGSNNLGFGGTWNDVFWLSSYNGGDVKKSVALVSSKYDNTSLWIAKQNYDSSSWGTGYLFWNSGNDGSGSGLDADTVDGVQGSSYLRSDASDTFNAGLGGTLDVQGIFKVSNSSATSQTLNISTASSGNVAYISNGSGGTVLFGAPALNTTNVDIQGTCKAEVFSARFNSNYYTDHADTGDSIRVAGDVVAYYSSDKRYKENIKPIESPIEKVKSIRGVTFEWNKKSHKETGKKDVGVIAQEVEEVLPEIVETRDNGYKAVDYQKLTAVLIEAVKDQQKQIDELKSIINGGS